MEHQLWTQVEELFRELIDSPAEFADRRLNDPAIDPEVAREVGELLRAHLQAPLAVEGRLRDDEGATTFTAGRRLGAYLLVAPLGVGGMGEVWLAEREEAGVRRKVAIKRIRRGLDDAEVRGRFALEHQVLARLSHRSIARLLEGGVDAEAVPYLVLEHVDGRPITEACDARRLSLDARLALFEEVCRAVAFAHANLIVHRDLKPANILVREDGEVRLLDFGIAKLLDPTPAGATLPATRQGLATPEYASPEQVTGQPITTATDVHALGVMLFELLAGRRPFADHEDSSLELARAIVDRLAPQPSDVVAAAADADRRSRAALRGLSPREHVRALAGDLDTIVATSLAKDPVQRYPSVERLGEDIARFRAGLTIRARPASLGYRLRTFVRRHRLAVAASLVAGAVLAVLLVQLLQQRVAVARERDLARAERDAAREVSDLLVSLFEADPYAAGDQVGDQTTLGEFLEAREVTVRRELVQRPQLRARLLTLLARLEGNLGRLDAAVALARDAVRERRERPAASDLDFAESLNVLGTILQERGEFAEAEAVFREALDIRVDELGELHADTAESLNNVGVLLATDPTTEDAAEGERLVRRGLEARRQIFGSDHLDTAQSLNNLAVFYYRRGDPGDLESAEGLLREALAIRTRLLGADHPWVANTSSNLASVLLELDRLDDAEALFDEAIRAWTASLGVGHARIAAGYYGLSRLREARGDLAGALAAARLAAEIDRQALPAEHAFVAEAARRIADLELRLSELEGRR